MGKVVRESRVLKEMIAFVTFVLLPALAAGSGRILCGMLSSELSKIVRMLNMIFAQPQSKR